MSSPFILPHSLRVLPPAGASASPMELAKTKREIARHQLEAQAESGVQNSPTSFLESYGLEYMQSFLGVERVLPRSSGKHALKAIFETLKSIDSRSYVALSAYTCPDVAVSAVAAGFKLICFDLDPETLQPRPESLSDSALSEVSAVVLSNLYGLPDDLEPWRDLRSRYDFLLVDDACQALQSQRGSSFVGTEADTLGVLSAGRGKALSGIGGGAVLCPSLVNTSEGSSSLQEKVQAALLSSMSLAFREEASGLKEFFKPYLQWFFSNPWAYRLPASLPFLGLGQTKCELSFLCGNPTHLSLLHMLCQLDLMMERQKRNLLNAKFWSEQLTSYSLKQPYLSSQELFESKGSGGRIVPLRYPVLLEDSSRRSGLLFSLKRRGLGANESYPRTLDSYSELNDYLKKSECDGARKVAKSIITLPLHRSVRNIDMRRTITTIKEAL